MVADLAGRIKAAVRRRISLLSRSVDPKWAADPSVLASRVESLVRHEFAHAPDEAFTPSTADVAEEENVIMHVVAGEIADGLLDDAIADILGAAGVEGAEGEGEGGRAG